MKIAETAIFMGTCSNAVTRYAMDICLPTRPTPIPHDFIGQDYTALGHQRFDAAVAEAEAKIEPHTVANDLGRKPMRFCGLVVGSYGEYVTQGASGEVGKFIGQYRDRGHTLPPQVT
jgi:hypothetical protein